MHAARVHPQQALAVYAESLATGARVAVFGDASTGLGERLIGLGARAVHVWDPDGRRAATVIPDTVADLVVEPYDTYEPPPGRVELAIVPELGSFEDPAELVARIRSLLGRQGVALIAAHNAAPGTPPPGSFHAFDYYELFDRVALAFESVRMVAAVPFHGVALVALGDAEDDPAVSVDSQLADADREPLSYLAIASQSEIPVDPYAIIELSEDAPRAASAEVALAGAARLEAEEARHRAEAAEARLDAEGARAAELEAELATRERQLSDLSAEVEEVRVAAEAGRIAVAEVESIAHRADRAESRVAVFEQEAALAIESHGAELLRLEDALRDRAQAIRQLESEVARRDRIVRDLLSSLEEAGQAPAIAVALETQAVAVAAPPDPAAAAAIEEARRLRDQLDGLALEVARREGDAQAMAWTVAELERRLAVAEQSAALTGNEERRESGEVPNGERVLHPSEQGAAEGEIHALRQALVQEHEARRRAESGEALAYARAEIERLTVLLEQAERDRAGGVSAVHPSSPSSHAHDGT
jgi:hypothetical protein